MTVAGLVLIRSYNDPCGCHGEEKTIKENVHERDGVRQAGCIKFDKDGELVRIVRLLLCLCRENLIQGHDEVMSGSY